MNNVIDAVPNISVITKIEVLGFNAPEKHYQLLMDFINDAALLNLTSDIVEVTIAIRRSYKIKLPDAIIAATAMVFNLTLITRNLSDFKKIKDFHTINPHSY